MKPAYNPNYASVEFLRNKARKKIPRFAFEYLDGGCNEELNLRKNTDEIREVELLPHYLSGNGQADISCELFGHRYDAPFGIAPVGLQGLVWPNAPEILARSAFKHNIPFILSTVSTSSIERISEITEGRAWFQLYHPAKDEVRDDLIERAAAAKCPVLVALSDVPAFGFRPKEIRNGLSMPPRMTLRNIVQIMGRPHWALRTLLHGSPSFETLRKYMPPKMNMHHLGQFMNSTFDGRLSLQKLSYIRDKWKGKLVVKGIVSPEDVEKCISIGVDGIIVSNHGGRQLDAATSAIYSLKDIQPQYGGKITLMMDSGIRSGPDVARTLACGAAFTFMGRTFMYGVAALGAEGADHTIHILKAQLLQVMRQVSCNAVEGLPGHLIK